MTRWGKEGMDFGMLKVKRGMDLSLSKREGCESIKSFNQ